MKVRTDIVRMYKDVHSWVGIVAGLALFIAFYAGAITMFERPLQRWASAPSTLAPPPSLEDAPKLVSAVMAEHPEAAHDYDIHVATGPEQPARMSWTVHEESGDHGPNTTFYASLAPDGSLQVEEAGPSPVAQFIDVLHQQVGLPLSHEIAMPIMGVISLLYAIAIVSGVIVLLPSLVKDLFTVRVGRNVKRMWLDVHNVLGVLSLPFHLIMALTAVVFAFHDQFYDAQGATFARPDARARTEHSAPAPEGTLLSPAELVRRLEVQAPGFRPVSIGFHETDEGQASVRVAGVDPRYGHRGPTEGFVGVDPYTGRIVATDYMPGHQDGWSAAITSFFALHFGNFGGAGVQWAYFLLGLAGALIFYTGNLLWIESRRKRERKSGAVEQTRATRILGALTVGVPLGCIAGVSATIAAAKPLGLAGTSGMHSAIYYAVFLAFVGWALVRGAARSGTDLLLGAIASMLLIPLASLLSIGGHPHQVPLVDILAILAAGAMFLAWRSALRRGRTGATDSIWSAPRPAVQGAELPSPAE